MEDSIKYSQCYVAFLDILGFKNIVNHWSCQEISDIFNSIKESRLSKILVDGQVFAPVEAVNYYIMSDSIVLYIDKSCSKGFLALSLCISYLQSVLAKQETPVFLRGAIVEGEIYRDENVIFGPAVSNAYLLSEGMAKHPRVIMTKELFNKAYSELREQDTAFKSPKQLWYEDQDEWMCVENLILITFPFDPTKMLAFLQHEINCQTDNSIREKYIYLKKHYKETIKTFNDLHNLHQAMKSINNPEISSEMMNGEMKV